MKLFIHARVTLEYFNFDQKGEMNLKDLLSTSIASVITSVKRLLEEMRLIYI